RQEARAKAYRMASVAPLNTHSVTDRDSKSGAIIIVVKRQSAVGVELLEIINQAGFEPKPDVVVQGKTGAVQQIMPRRKSAGIFILVTFQRTRCDRLQLSIRSDHLAELQGDRVRGVGRTSDLGGNTVPSRAGQRRHGSVREFLSKGGFRDRGAGTPRTICKLQCFIANLKAAAQAGTENAARSDVPAITIGVRP